MLAVQQAVQSTPSQPDAASGQQGGRVLGDSLQPPVSTLMKSIKPTKIISMLTHQPGIQTKPIGVTSPRSQSPTSSPSSPACSKPAARAPGQLSPNPSTISITAPTPTPRTVAAQTAPVTTHQPSSTQDLASQQSASPAATPRVGVVPSLSLGDAALRRSGMSSTGTTSLIQRQSHVAESPHRLSTTGSASSTHRQGQLLEPGQRLSSTGSTSILQRQGTVRASPRPSSAAPWHMASPRQMSMNSTSPRGSGTQPVMLQPRRAFVGSMSLAGKARSQVQGASGKGPPGSVSSRQLPEALVASRRESVAGSSTHRSIEDDGPGEARRNPDGSHLSLFQTLDADDQHDQGATRSVNFSQNVLESKPWRAAVLGQRGTVETHTRRMKEREEVFRSLSTWSKDVLASRAPETGHGTNEDGVLLEHIDADQLELEERLVDESMRPDPLGLGYQLRAYWNATVQEEVELRFNKMREKWDADMAQEMEELHSLRGRVKELTTQYADTKDKLISLQLKYEMMVRQGIGRPAAPRPVSPAPAPAAQEVEAQPPQGLGAAQEQNQATAEDSTAITTADALSFAEEVERLKLALANSKMEHAQAMDHAKTAMDALDNTLKDREKTRQELERAKDVLEYVRLELEDTTYCHDAAWLQTELAIQGMHMGETEAEMQKVHAELEEVRRQLARAQNGIVSPRTKAITPISPARSSPGNKGRTNSSPPRPGTAGTRQATTASHSNPNKPGAKLSLGSQTNATSAGTSDERTLGSMSGVEPLMPSRAGMHAGSLADEPQLAVSPQRDDLQVAVQASRLSQTSVEPAGRVTPNISSSGAAPPTASLKAEAVHWQREAERLNEQAQALKQQLEVKAAMIEQLETRLHETGAEPTTFTSLKLSSTSHNVVEAGQDTAMVARMAKVDAELMVARQQAKDLRDELAQTKKELEGARAPPLSTNQLEVALEVERTRRMQLLHNLQEQVVQGLQELQVQCHAQQQHRMSEQQIQAKLDWLHQALQSLVSEQWEGLESVRQVAAHQQAGGRQAPGRSGAGRMVQLKVSDLQGLLANSTAKLQQLFELGGVSALLKQGGAAAAAHMQENPLLPGSSPSSGLVPGGSNSYSQRLSQWLAATFSAGAVNRHQHPVRLSVGGQHQQIAGSVAGGTLPRSLTPADSAGGAAGPVGPQLQSSGTGAAAAAAAGPPGPAAASGTASAGLLTAAAPSVGAAGAGTGPVLTGGPGHQVLRPLSPKRMSVIGNESVTAARLGVYGTIAESSQCEVGSDSGHEQEGVLLNLPTANSRELSSEANGDQLNLQQSGGTLGAACLLAPWFTLPQGSGGPNAVQGAVRVQTVGGPNDAAVAPLKRLRPMSAAQQSLHQAGPKPSLLQASEQGHGGVLGVGKHAGTFARHHAAYVGHRADLPSTGVSDAAPSSNQNLVLTGSQGHTGTAGPQSNAPQQPEGHEGDSGHDGPFLGVSQMSVMQVQRTARKGGDGGFARSSAPVGLGALGRSSEHGMGRLTSTWGIQQLHEAHVHATQQVLEQQHQNSPSSPQRKEQEPQQGAGAAAQANKMRWTSLPLEHAQGNATGTEQTVGSPHSRTAACIAAFAAKQNYASKNAADDRPASPGTRSLLPLIPSEGDVAPPVPLVVQQQIRAESPPHLHHNIYQAQHNQPAGAFKVRMLTATPQKGVQQRPGIRPRPHSAALTLSGSTMLPLSLGLNLVEPGQGPPQLAPSPQPVLLSAQVGSTQGLAVPMRTWSLYTQGAPAGGLLHVPGTERPVYSGIEMMSRAELVRTLRESQASHEQLYKRFSQVVQDMQRYEGVHDELAAEVAEARQHWVAENQYNAMLQEELERMQAILEIISQTAYSIVDAEEPAPAKEQPLTDKQPASNTNEEDAVLVGDSVHGGDQGEGHQEANVVEGVLQKTEQQKEERGLGSQSASLGSVSLAGRSSKSRQARSQSASPESRSPRNSRARSRGRSRSTSPDSPAFKRALSLKVDLKRIKCQQEEHLEKTEAMAEGLGLPSPVSYKHEASLGKQRGPATDAAGSHSASTSRSVSPDLRAASPDRSVVDT